MQVVNGIINNPYFSQWSTSVRTHPQITATIIALAVSVLVGLALYFPVIQPISFTAAVILIGSTCALIGINRLSPGEKIAEARVIAPPESPVASQNTNQTDPPSAPPPPTIEPTTEPETPEVMTREMIDPVRPPRPDYSLNELVTLYREGPFVNTGLLSELIPLAFRSNTDVTAQQTRMRDFIGRLVQDARQPDTAELAIQALTQHNNPGEDPTQLKKIFDGFPINTPLAMLIKMGDAPDQAIAILPFYEEKDLLVCSTNGNSVLHTAILTGQLNIASAILRRAREIDPALVVRLLNLQNIKEKTAQNLFDAIVTSKNINRDIRESFSDANTGEEIQKAYAAHDARIFHIRGQYLRYWQQQLKERPESLSPIPSNWRIVPEGTTLIPLSTLLGCE